MDNVNVLLEPIRASLHQVGAFLPRVVLAIAILIAGWLVAKAVRFALVKTLRALNFNVITDKAGIDAFLRQGGGDIDTIRVLGALAYWLVILAAIMIAFNSLDLAYVTDLVGRIVLFVPRVMVAVVVLVFGAYFARFVSGALTVYLKNIGAGEAALLGRLSPVRDHGVRHPDRARPARARRNPAANVPDPGRGGGARAGARVRPGRPAACRRADRAVDPAARNRNRHRTKSVF